MRGGLKTLILAIAAVAALAACGRASPLESLTPGERGRVVRIIDGDSLALETGLTVRLVSLESPSRAYGDRSADPYSEEAARLLEDLALGREVRLFYPGLTRDRYDRALAHVETIDALGPDYWLNLEMARRGGGRVRIYPDTATLGEHLIAAENAARSEDLGLWRTGSFDIPAAANVPTDARGFLIVSADIEGRIGRPPPGASCTLKLSDASLLVDVETRAVGVCRMTGAVRLRGYVRDGRMNLAHALNAERLDPDT